MKCKFLLIFQVQQRYILAANLFLTFGVACALRMCFSLILTQIVYVPNTGANVHESNISDELTCPIKYSRSHNGTTTNSVRSNRKTKSSISCSNLNV